MLESLKVAGYNNLYAMDVTAEPLQKIARNMKDICVVRADLHVNLFATILLTL